MEPYPDNRVPIGVVGAGTLGVQISAHLLHHGYRVILKTRSVDINGSVKKRVIKILEKYESEGRDPSLDLEVVTNYYALEKCKVVIEAVLEDLSVKIGVLSGIEDVVSHDALIFTNSSSISIDRLAEAFISPERFLGFHFFNPVSKMGLIEVVVGTHTDHATVQKALELVDGIGKEPVVVRNSPGFIVNRLLMWQINEASRMVEAGVSTIEDIDKAVRLGLNHPLGPFQLADLIGLDVCFSILKTLERDLGLPGYAPSSLIKDMVQKGQLGKKAGQGFYDYSKKQP